METKCYSNHLPAMGAYSWLPWQSTQRYALTIWTTPFPYSTIDGQSCTTHSIVYMTRRRPSQPPPAWNGKKTFYLSSFEIMFKRRNAQEHFRREEHHTPQIHLYILLFSVRSSNALSDLLGSFALRRGGRK